MSERLPELAFDVVVIGAGPAGLSCAYMLQKMGYQVIVIERGDSPGTKNVMGGIVYAHPARQIISNFDNEAPLQRHIVQQELWAVDGEDSIRLSYKSKRLDHPPYNSFTVFRSPFDNWLANQIEKAGVTLITKTKVTEFLWDEDKVVGVSTDRPEGDIRSKIVILAEGANSLLAIKAKLLNDIPLRSATVSVKQVLSLPAEIIEERFNLSESEGMTIEAYGSLTPDMLGQVWIYTNNNSLSFGLGSLISDFRRTSLKPYEVIESVKEHPFVRPYLEGSVLREYMAHIIPELGYDNLPKLYTNGLMVIGDAAGLANPIHREGINMAMISGKISAYTADSAFKKNDFTIGTLCSYRQKLEDSFIMKDLIKYRHAVNFLEARRQALQTYISWTNQTAYDFTVVDNVPKRIKQNNAFISIKKKRKGLWGILKDLYGAWKSFK